MDLVYPYIRDLNGGQVPKTRKEQCIYEVRSDAYLFGLRHRDELAALAAGEPGVIFVDYQATEDPRQVQCSFLSSIDCVLNEWKCDKMEILKASHGAYKRGNLLLAYRPRTTWFFPKEKDIVYVEIPVSKKGGPGHVPEPVHR